MLFRSHRLILGKRPLKNAQGDIVDPKTLSDSEILEHVLLWSHIPGVSRHHWGTDLDIFDASWYKLHQQTLSLENVDFLEGGPSARLHSFNEQLLQKKQWSAFPFFRPYELGNNFMRELWHYSHRPMATIFLQAYSFDIFVKNLQLSQQLLLRDLLLDGLS